MEKLSLVIARYDEPEKMLGVHYDDSPHTALIPAEVLDEYFELGNEIEVTAQQLREGTQIPVEWKSDQLDDEWLLGRVTAYDTITPRKPL